MATMLAARLYKVGEPMKLEQVPVPEPRPTDVLVAVKGATLIALGRGVTRILDTARNRKRLAWLSTGREPVLLVAVMVGGK